MAFSRAYRSQSEYGPQGLRICTPVTLLVCDRFVRGRGESVAELFTTEVVDDFMRSAHDMYERRFPNARGPVSMSTLMGAQRFVPNSREVAGTVHGSCEPLIVDDMTIAPLSTLFEECMRSDRSTDCALLLTMCGHTTGFLFEHPERRAYHFDPLPASLKDVTSSVHGVDYSLDAYRVDAEYNGTFITSVGV